MDRRIANAEGTVDKMIREEESRTRDDEKIKRVIGKGKEGEGQDNFEEGRQREGWRIGKGRGEDDTRKWVKGVRKQLKGLYEWKKEVKGKGKGLRYVGAERYEEESRRWTYEKEYGEREEVATRESAEGRRIQGDERMIVIAVEEGRKGKGGKEGECWWEGRGKSRVWEIKQEWIKREGGEPQEVIIMDSRGEEMPGWKMMMDLEGGGEKRVWINKYKSGKDGEQIYKKRRGRCKE